MPVFKQGDLVLGGRYRIDDLAGEKKSCVAFKATRVSDGAPIALKTLAPSIRKQRHVVSRLMARAKFAMEMDHPNLIPVHEIREEGDAFFIAESWFEALPLLRLVREKGSCSPYETAWLASQLSRGVDHLISRSAPSFDFTLSDVYVEIGDPHLGVRLSVLALEGDGFSERALATPTDSAQPLVRSVARIIFNLVTGGMGDPLVEPVLSEDFTASLRDCLTGAIQHSTCRDLLWTLFGNLGPEISKLLPVPGESKEDQAGEAGSPPDEGLETLKDQLRLILDDGKRHRVVAAPPVAVARPPVPEKRPGVSNIPVPAEAAPLVPPMAVLAADPVPERDHRADESGNSKPGKKTMALLLALLGGIALGWMSIRIMNWILENQN